MSQIDIQVLKQGITYPNILSCSFFSFKEAYKPLSAYTRNLNIFLYKANFLVKDFEIRLYVDNTSKDIALPLAKEYPNVSVLLFDCQPFRDGEGHVGFFGSLVRLLPLFEKHEIVWISDIDIIIHTLTDWKFKEDIAFSTQFCYSKLRTNKYSIVLQKFLSKVKFPRQLLTRFLTKCLEGKYSEKIKDLNEENSLHRKPESKFPYGMDEVFMSAILYEWIKKNDFTILLYVEVLTDAVSKYWKGNKENRDEFEHIYNDYFRTLKYKNVSKFRKFFLKAYTELAKTDRCAEPYLKILNDPSNFNDGLYPKISIKSSDL
jgi:hypothetical protein